MRIWAIITCTVLLFSIIGGLCIRGLDNITNSMIENSSQMAFVPLLTLGIVISILSIVIYGVVTTILILVRFYQNFFTDEAYLTFTLPVKRSTLFNSKLLCSFIFNIATALITIIAVGVMLAIAPGGMVGGSALEAMFNSFELPIEYIELLMQVEPQIDFWLTTYVIVAIIFFLVYFVYVTMLLFGTVTFGSLIAKKYKLIASIAVFYGVQLLLSAFWAIFQSIITVGLEAAAKIPDFLQGSEIFWLILGILMIYICIFALLSVFFYKFTLGKLRGNLNLA